MSRHSSSVFKGVTLTIAAIALIGVLIACQTPRLERISYDD